MTTQFSLSGQLPVKASADAALAGLERQLEPGPGDEVAIRDGVLRVRIDNTVPCAYVDTALYALHSFATCHARAAGWFDVNGSRRLFGPDEAACLAERRADLRRQLAALRADLSALDAGQGELVARARAAFASDLVVIDDDAETGSGGDGRAWVGARLYLPPQ